MFLNIPFPFLVMLYGALYWPASLFIIVAAAGTGVTFRGPWRVVLFTMAGLVAANMVLGFALVLLG